MQKSKFLHEISRLDRVQLEQYFNASTKRIKKIYPLIILSKEEREAINNESKNK